MAFHCCHYPLTDGGSVKQHIKKANMRGLSQCFNTGEKRVTGELAVTIHINISSNFNHSLILIKLIHVMQY